MVIKVRLNKIKIKFFYKFERKKIIGIFTVILWKILENCKNCKN